MLEHRREIPKKHRNLGNGNATTGALYGQHSRNMRNIHRLGIPLMRSLVRQVGIQIKTRVFGIIGQHGHSSDWRYAIKTLTSVESHFVF